MCLNLLFKYDQIMKHVESETGWFLTPIFCSVFVLCFMWISKCDSLLYSVLLHVTSCCKSQICVVRETTRYFPPSLHFRN